LPDDSERVPPLGAGKPKPSGRIESSYLPRSPLPEFVAILYLAVNATRKSRSRFFLEIFVVVGVFTLDAPWQRPSGADRMTRTAELGA
jgi:hypothetical protein